MSRDPWGRDLPRNLRCAAILETVFSVLVWAAVGAAAVLLAYHVFYGGSNG